MIKTTIVSKKGVKKPFPKIMESITRAGRLVLFTTREEGVVIRESEDAYGIDRLDVGHFSDEWAPDCFMDWSGTIELTQD